MPSATSTTMNGNNSQSIQDQSIHPPSLPPISIQTAPILNPPARFSTVCQNVYRASTQSLILLSNSSSSSAKDRSARHSRAATTTTTTTSTSTTSNFVNPSSSSTPIDNNPFHFSTSNSLFNHPTTSPIIPSNSTTTFSSKPNSDSSSIPSESSAPFLRSLKLKTILLLSPEHAPASLINFCRKDDIHLVHVGLEGQVLDLPTRNGQPQRMGILNESLSSTNIINTSINGSVGILNNSSPFPTTMITERMVKDGLEMLLDVRTHPILVLDDSGIHETGVLIGCMRKMMRWNFASIVVEYRSFAGSRARAANERFIEMFDTELITIPPRPFMPSWLEEDQEDQEIEFELDDEDS